MSRYKASRYIDDVHRAGAPCDDLPEGLLRSLIASGAVVEVQAEEGAAAAEDAGQGSVWPEGLSDQAIDGLEEAAIAPEDVRLRTDEELLAADHVGPASLRLLREAFGGPITGDSSPDVADEDGELGPPHPDFEGDSADSEDDSEPDPADGEEE